MKTFMGVGRIFSSREQYCIFSRGGQNNVFMGANSGDISFYPLESKKHISLLKIS